jgi:hypothetical protein
MDLVIIPGGMTSQLQVLYVVVNKPFKDELCRLYGEWLLSHKYFNSDDYLIPEY